MAKQIGVVQISGALGEIVGAKKSAGQKQNIIRVRAYEPKNPRTDDQMIQRLKAKAATNIYSALKEILNHSYEGVKYGAPSRNFFMQQAMLMAEGTFPWLVKGDSNPIPGAMMISKGSLMPIGIIEDFESKGVFNFTLFNEDPGRDFNIDGAKLSLISQLFNKNFSTKDGDQLTFVVFSKCVDNADRVYYYPSYSRVILNSQATDDVLFINSLSNQSITFSNRDVDILFRSNPDGHNGLDPVGVAAAVIISRPVVNGDQVEWQRSTTYLTLSEKADFKALFDETAKKKALASFKKATADPKSAWYLNQGKLS